jgi:hypothetical protein
MATKIACEKSVSPLTFAEMEVKAKAKGPGARLPTETELKDEIDLIGKAFFPGESQWVAIKTAGVDGYL